MSALALIMQSRGHTVSGSDAVDSQTLKNLTASGVKTVCGHSYHGAAGADLAVVTAAATEDNPEVLGARSRGIRIIGRAELLGEIMDAYPNSVAVAGTHGKTTTTGMIASVLEPLDPTVHIGGELPGGGNVRLGGGKIFITEACEYKRAFLSLHPSVGVILNVDADHLDYYRDIDDIEGAFADFARNIKPGGRAVCNGGDARARRACKSNGRTAMTFGSGNAEAAELSADEFGRFSFDIYEDKKFAARARLRVPGLHNVDNALAAYLAGRAFELQPQKIADALGSFAGVGRRYESAGKLNGAQIILDYAHHPKEIAAVIELARLTRPKRLICAFQPHTYSRTKSLFNGFTEALSRADIIYTAPIYAAREAPINGITSDAIADELKKRGCEAHASRNFPWLARALKNKAVPGDLILILGAGDIAELIPLLTKRKDNN